MKLSALVQKEREIQIRVGDAPEDVVNVTYAPGRLTLEIADEIQAIATSKGAGGEMYAMTGLLEPIMVSWDLENEDGSPLPCDASGLKKLPLEFMAILMEAITTDVKPNPPTAENSDDGSVPTELSADAPTGTQSLQPQGSLV